VLGMLAAGIVPGGHKEQKPSSFAEASTFAEATADREPKSGSISSEFSAPPR
jgi:hypothetical protein